AALAVALTVIRVAQPDALDRPIAAAVRALELADRESPAGASDGSTPHERLARSLDRHLASHPDDRRARLVRARIAERADDIVRARAHYAVLSFVEPGGIAAEHLSEMTQVNV